MKYPRFISVFIFISQIFYINTNDAQIPYQLEWSNRFEDNNSGGLSPLMTNVEDGSTMVCGHQSFVQSDIECRMMDINGDLQWEYLYNNSSGTHDFLDKLMVDAEGDFYLLTSLLRYIDYEYVNIISVIKLSNTGDLIWIEDYWVHDDWHTRATDCLVTENGDVYVTGFYNPSVPPYFHNKFVIKLNSAGEIQWENLTPDATGFNVFILDNKVNVLSGITTGTSSIIRLNKDTGEYISSDTITYEDTSSATHKFYDSEGNFYFTQFTRDYKITKFSNSGVEEWVYSLPVQTDWEDSMDRILVVYFDENNNPIVSGDYFNENSEKLSVTTLLDRNTGDIIWQYTFDSDRYFKVKDIAKDDFGTISIAGYEVDLETNERTAVAINIDENGGFLSEFSNWGNTLNNGEQFYDFNYINDQLYILGSINGDSTFVLKMSSITNQVTPSLENREAISLFPNPAMDKIYIGHNLHDEALVNIKLIDTNGKTIKTLHSTFHYIETANFKSGIYYLEFNFKNGERVGKKIMISN